MNLGFYGNYAASAISPPQSSSTCAWDMLTIQPGSWIRCGQRENGEPWVAYLGRAIPIEQTFTFRPETLTEQLKEAVTPFAARMAEGAFYVRLERRGLLRK